MMACFMNIFAIAVLLTPEVSAATCAQGSCLEDDVASFVQVKKIVKTSAERDDPIVQEALKVVDDSEVPMVGDMDVDVAEGSIPVEAEDSENPVDKMIVNEDRMVADDMNDDIMDAHLGQSVLPPPVGHGQVAPNPDLVTDRAIDAEVPGPGNGNVINAYEASLDSASGRMKEYAHRDVDAVEDAMMHRENMEDELANQDAAFEDQIQHNRESEQNTLAGKREMEQAAINTVANAEEDFEKKAIKKSQTDMAVVEGTMEGVRRGAEDAAEDEQVAANGMVKRAEERRDQAMRTVVEDAREKGITAEQRAKTERDLEDQAYLRERAKQLAAGVSQDDAKKALVEGDMVGPEHLKEHQIAQMARRSADRLKRMADRALDDTADATEDGIEAVVNDRSADEVTGMGPVAQGAMADALVNGD